MSVPDTLREAAARLADSSATPRLDAELLMAEALGLSRSNLLLRATDLIVPPDFEAMLERRLNHEPIAYILGRQEFYGREFAVSPDVLIPRSDSEALIEPAIDRMGTTGSMLDLGTGSGALLLTLLAEKPGWRGTGIDRSKAALEIASKNAHSLGLANRVVMQQRDWSKRDWMNGLGQLDLVIANPPYVEVDARLDPDVRDFEPAGALFAGKDGLDDYRRIIPLLRSLLDPEGFAVFEIGHRQDAAVTALALEHGFAVHLVRDLANRPRGLILT